MAVMQITEQGDKRHRVCPLFALNDWLVSHQNAGECVRPSRSRFTFGRKLIPESLSHGRRGTGV
jgi:hypothetical protein